MNQKLKVSITIKKNPIQQVCFNLFKIDLKKLGICSEIIFTKVNSSEKASKNLPSIIKIIPKRLRVSC